MHGLVSRRSRLIGQLRAASTPLLCKATGPLGSHTPRAQRILCSTEWKAVANWPQHRYSPRPQCKRCGSFANLLWIYVALSICSCQLLSWLGCFWLRNMPPVLGRPAYAPRVWVQPDMSLSHLADEWSHAEWYEVPEPGEAPSCSCIGIARPQGFYL